MHPNTSIFQYFPKSPSIISRLSKTKVFSRVFLWPWNLMGKIRDFCGLSQRPGNPVVYWDRDTGRQQSQWTNVKAPHNPISGQCRHRTNTSLQQNNNPPNINLCQLRSWAEKRLNSLNPLKGTGVNWLQLAIQVQPTFLISDIRALWRCPNVRN